MSTDTAWTTSIGTLPGVGPERCAQFERLGIRTVGDLLWHRPRAYEDRRRVRPIAELQRGEAALVQGRVVALGVKRWRRRQRSVFELIVEDGVRRLHCRWWNMPYLEAQFRVGETLLVWGKVADVRPPSMDHPETEVLEPGDDVSVHVHRIVPVYPLTEGLSQRWLRRLIWRTLARPDLDVPDRLAALLPAAPTSEAESSMPPADQRPSRWSCRQAIERLHFPTGPDDPPLARQRLALEELLELQLEVQGRRRRMLARAPMRPGGGDNRWVRPFLKGLGFPLTDAQTRVLRDIRADLRSGRPMRRLLQGDVGSGKTVVAAATALMCLEGGDNVVVMAPTEILAEQHGRTFRRWLEPLGIGVRLHTGNRRDPEPAASASAGDAAASAGRPTLVVGTHALIEDGFHLDRLGLVIIDEQHKFGVDQREALLRKGDYPHLLVMTATPIPRTLGLTLYGDLDLSVIDALPPGRGRVRTFVRGPERLPKVWAFVRRRLEEGRQAFVVCPRIDNVEPGGVRAVEDVGAALGRELAPFEVGLLHGRLAAEERDRVMTAFRDGQLRVLVATSVVEVGVDIPNATLMVIQDAEQFGLAQLHQMRGRIGRGGHEAQCVLVARELTADARERLRVLEQTTDGFRVAEEDLRLRGAGELLGDVQSGRPMFRFADLAQDLALVEEARALAKRLIDTPKGAG